MKKGALPSDSRVTSMRPKCAIMSFKAVAPLFGEGEGVVDVRSSVTSGTQLASMPMIVLKLIILLNLWKKSMRSLPSTGAYIDASVRFLPSIYVSRSMPLLSGRVLMVDLILSRASW